MALLEIRNVTRRFGALTAVDNVSIAIEAGEFFTLLGPSGCGKTTLLRMIAGFDVPDGGRIVLNGEDIADLPPERRPMRMVFQSYALFPHMTDDQNEALALSHRIAVMNEGRVEQVDEPSKIYGFPRTRFVADFIGHCNLFSGALHGNANGVVTLDVEGLGPVRVATDSSLVAGRAGSV